MMPLLYSAGRPGGRPLHLPSRQDCGCRGRRPDALPYTHANSFYAAGRPEAVPYICSLGSYVRVGGDAHIAPPYITLHPHWSGHTFSPFRRLAPAGGFFFRKRSKNRAQVLGLVGAISSNLFTLAAPTPLAASLESRGCFCGKRGMRFAHRANPLDIAPCPAQARIWALPLTHIGADMPFPSKRWQRRKPLTERA